MKKIALACDRQAPTGSVFTFKQDYANEAYTSAILKAGGYPLLIPYCEPTKTDEIIKAFDALVLMGGHDISPALYGEEIVYSQDCDEALDRFHMALVTSAMKYMIPVLGICRGFQLLNIAFGGTLYQDLEKEHGVSINHNNLDIPYDIAHEVNLVEGTVLYEIAKEKHIGVNSLHHQGIKDLGFGLKVSAYAPDGLIEAFESEGIYGVQWHPEAIPDRMEVLFSSFVKDIAKRERL